MVIIRLLVLIVAVTSGIGAESYTAGYEDEKPFHFKDSTGTIVGTDAEILREALKRTGSSVLFKKVPWTRTLMSVKEGNLAIAIGAKFTEERNRFAFYSKSYKGINHWLYTKNEQHKEITSLEQLVKQQPCRVGIVRGWGYPPEIAKLINDPQYKKRFNTVNSFAQLPEMLREGRLDGIIATPAMLRETITYHSDFDVRAKYSEKLHFLFSRKLFTKEFIMKFNGALNELHEEGYIKEVMEKYVPQVIE